MNTTKPAVTYVLAITRGKVSRHNYVNFSDGVSSRAPFVSQFSRVEDAERMARSLANAFDGRVTLEDCRAAVLIARDELIDAACIEEVQ